MVYCCGKCQFLFERTAEAEQCPDCGSLVVRQADESERQEFLKLKAEFSNVKKTGAI